MDKVDQHTVVHRTAFYREKDPKTRGGNAVSQVMRESMLKSAREVIKVM